jgi:methylated-DNA-[protein]-cysteine S-methyltransferase
MKIYCDRIDTPVGVLSLVSTGKGLAFVGLKDARGKAADAYIARNFPGAEVMSGGTVNKKAAKELAEYFRGRRRTFGVKIDLRAGGFTKHVLARVRKIAYGKTLTYGEIASALGNPGAARAVGAANGANPIPIIIPCHRVVASNGLGGYGGGLPMKRKLLQLETAGRIAPKRS